MACGRPLGRPANAGQEGKGQHLVCTACCCCGLAAICGRKFAGLEGDFSLLNCRSPSCSRPNSSLPSFVAKLELRLELEMDEQRAQREEQGPLPAFQAHEWTQIEAEKRAQ